MSSPPQQFILLLAIFILRTQSVVYPVVVNYMVYDLYSTEPIDFAALASEWTITNPITPSAYRVGYCGAMLMLGGTGLLGTSTILQRTYTSLPAHSYISFILRAVNSNLWVSSSDSVSIYIDGALFITQYPAIDVPSAYQSNCGHTTHDLIWYHTSGVIAHSSNTLTLKYIISNSAPSTASYGLYKLNILLRTTTPYYTYSSCVSGPYSLLGGCTLTPAGDYTGTDGISRTCDISCNNVCFGPGSSGCYGCDPSYFFNGIDCLPCDSSCVSCSGTASNQCTVCKRPKMLQADNSCSTTTCLSPYTLDTNGGDLMNCVYSPCLPGQLIFYTLNNTVICVATCNSPYAVFSTTFCSLCKALGYNHLYDSTGTIDCNPCTAPYQAVQNSQYCLLCDLGTFVWYTSSGQLVCRSTCPTPYRVVNFVYCEPCSLGQFIYYTPSGEVACMQTCVLPYVALDSTHCVLPPTNMMITAVQATKITSSVLSKVLLLVSSGASGLLLWSCLADMLKYIRYIDIRYTEKLVDLFSMPSLTDMIEDQMPTVAIHMTAQFPEYPLPSSIEKYQSQSDFIVNSWVWMLTLITVIFIVLLNNQFRRCCSNRFLLLRKIADLIKRTLQWNYCISTFVDNYGCLVLYSSLQFLVASQCNSGWEIVSIVVCACMNIVGLALLGRIANVIWIVQKRSQSTPSASSINPSDASRANAVHATVSQLNSSSVHPNYHGTYAIILEDFKSNSLLRQGCFLMYIIRIYLFYTIIVFLVAYPGMQCALFLVLSFCVLIYIALVRPMRKMLDLIFTIMQELILLIVNACTTILSVLDKQSSDSESAEMRDSVENAILWCNMIFFGSTLLYCTISLAQQIHAAVVKIRVWRKLKQSTTRTAALNSTIVTTTSGTVPNCVNDSYIEGTSNNPILTEDHRSVSESEKRDQHSVNFNESSLVQSSYNNQQHHSFSPVSLKDLSRAYRLRVANRHSSISDQREAKMNNKPELIQQAPIHNRPKNLDAYIVDEEMSRKDAHAYMEQGYNFTLEDKEDLPEQPTIKSRTVTVESDDLQIDPRERALRGLSSITTVVPNRHLRGRQKNQNNIAVSSLYEQKPTEEKIEDASDRILSTHGLNPVIKDFIDRRIRLRQVVDYSTYMEHQFRDDVKEMYSDKKRR